jgi:hypothetical protein
MIAYSDEHSSHRKRSTSPPTRQLSRIKFDADL